MRTSFDFSPFFRPSVGFDRVFDLLENAGKFELVDTRPLYDIIRTGKDSYRISMAVAGFALPEEVTLDEQQVLDGMTWSLAATPASPDERLDSLNLVVGRRLEWPML
jgi:hypothetical protein